MKSKIILDTSPLVAFIDKSDRFHNWAVETWKTLSIPLLTCESVIYEAFFLLQRTYGGKNAVMSLLNTGTISIAFHLDQEIAII